MFVGFPLTPEEVEGDASEGGNGSEGEWGRTPKRFSFNFGGVMWPSLKIDIGLFVGGGGGLCSRDGGLGVLLSDPECRSLCSKLLFASVFLELEPEHEDDGDEDIW